MDKAYNKLEYKFPSLIYRSLFVIGMDNDDVSTKYLVFVRGNTYFTELEKGPLMGHSRSFPLWRYDWSARVITDS